jgi:hypothetical protein
VNLEYNSGQDEYDLSTLSLSERKYAVLHAENMCVDKRHLRLIRFSSAIWKALAFALPVFKSWQRSIYERSYTVLDRMQADLNPCGWGRCGKKKDGKLLCRRPERQCCEHTYPCEYLDYGGCPVRSLCCKLWLCAPAMRYLNALARQDKAGKLCRKFLRKRRSINFWLRMTGVPLRGRCSVEDAFSGELGWEMNTDIERWYDGVIIRDRWVFPSKELAEKERQGKG